MRGLAFVMVTVFMWSIGPLFVKFFTAYYDPWTQNAFRYGTAAVMLLALAWARGYLRYPLTARQWRMLMLVAFTNIIMQADFVAIYYFIYPSVASLVTRVNIVFVTVLSFIIFRDERRVVRSPRFIGGALLTLAGVFLVIATRDRELLSQLQVGETRFWIGVGLTLAFAFLSALYMVTIKHAVTHVPPLVSFTHVAWMTALGLSGPMLLSGGMRDLWQQPAWGLGLMAFSALLSIVLAHSFYYAALRHISTVVSSSTLQLVPVVTCVASAFVYGDRLSPPQMVGAAAVVGGAWLAALAQDG